MAISNQLGIGRLNTIDKELLLTRYKDLVFADDVTQLKCTGLRCEKVLIYNFKINCGHHICENCKSKLILNKWKCRECKTVIKNVIENDIEVERKIIQLRVHCLNKKYGCDEILIVSELLSHLNQCENTRENSMPVEYTGPRNVSLIMDKIGELANQVGEDHKQLNQLTFQIEQNQEQLNQLIIKVEQNQEKIDLQSKQIIHLLESNNAKKGRQNDFDDGKNIDDEKINLKTIKNVVLLGESGSGKSTLINAFDSYYRHQSFEDALADKTTFKIPTNMTFTGDNYKEINIHCDNEEPNECMNPKESSTKKCRSYVIPVNDDFGIRFIDTPGFASTRGPKCDQENANHIVDYLSQYEDLYAVAIVVRGKDSTLTTKFQYWFQQILTILPKSVCNNVIFIFSNGNKPNSSLTALRKELNAIIKEYKVIEHLKPSKENIFSFENEGLITIAAKHQNVKINKNDVNVSKTNWTTSKGQSEHFIKWLKNSAPFKCVDIINLNDVRLLLSDVYKINKQHKSRLKYEYEPSKIPERDQQEQLLLNEATKKACNFIIDNAILCTNFKKHDYKIDFNKSSSEQHKKSIKGTSITSLFIDILNSQAKIISESYWPQFHHLKRKLVTTSIHSSQFCYLFQLPKSI